ncbi:MAG: hypothetical protein ACRDST_15460 [Pseudonocardiaceae bacterium]
MSRDVLTGIAAGAVGEVLPLGRKLPGSAVRDQVNAVARRLESELGPEQYMFAEGRQRDWTQLPRPDLPLIVGLDGGYVHSSAQTSRRDGWFEVIAGKSMPTDGPRSASPSCRRSTPSRNGGCSMCCAARACRPTSLVVFLNRPRRGHPGPAALPQPPLRALPGLIPHHHAPHCDVQHGQEPALPSTQPRPHTVTTTRPRGRGR